MMGFRPPVRLPLAASSRVAGAGNWEAKGWTGFWKQNIYRLGYDNERDNKSSPSPRPSPPGRGRIVAGAMSTFSAPKPPHFLSSGASAFRYVEKTNPRTSNLKFLTYGVYELEGPVQSGTLGHAGEEALLFCWQGKAVAHLGQQDYRLDHYDVLYIPAGMPYQLSQGEGASKGIVCRAPSEKNK